MISPVGEILARGPLTDANRKIIRENYNLLFSELIGAGRYTPGTLDAIYRINLDEYHLAPSINPEQRKVYFTWDENKREKFNERSTVIEEEHGLPRPKAKRFAFAEMMD